METLGKMKDIFNAMDNLQLKINDEEKIK